MAEKVPMMTMMAVICKLSSASLSVVRQKRRGKNVKVRPLKKHQNVHNNQDNLQEDVLPAMHCSMFMGIGEKRSFRLWCCGQRLANYL